MNSDETVYNTISDATKTPGVRMTWGPSSCEPRMPFFVYERTNGGEVDADNRTYARLPRYRVTVFMETYDETLVERFADAVATFGPYRQHDDYDEAHDAFTASFEFTYHGRPREDKRD